MKADNIASDTAKTGKMTAVVAVMSIFKKKRCKLRSTTLGNERPSPQKAKRADFPEKKYPWIEKPFSKLEKRPDTEES